MSCSRRCFLTGLAGAGAAAALPACAPDVHPAPRVQATATDMRVALELAQEGA